MRLRPAPIMALLSIPAVVALAACSGPPHSSVANFAPPTEQVGSTMVADHISPDKCQTSGVLRVLPCKLSFTQPSHQTSATVSGKGVLTSKVTGCTGIATFSYFDYGIWYISSTQKAGTCSAVFTGLDKHKHAVGTATLKITSTF